MCEVQIIQSTEFNSIKSDTFITRQNDGVHYSQKLGAFIEAWDQKSIGMSCLYIATSVEGIAIDRFSEMVLGGHWRQLTGQKNDVSRGTEKSVCLRDVIGSELCISSYSGQKVFDTLKSEILQGNRVCLSFENIKSLSTAFLRSAIGQLYNGEIKENIDEMISFANLSPGRELVIDEVIWTSKEYYSDPDRYVAKLKELFADD